MITVQEASCGDRGDLQVLGLGGMKEGAVQAEYVGRVS